MGRPDEYRLLQHIQREQPTLHGHEAGQSLRQAVVLDVLQRAFLLLADVSFPPTWTTILGPALVDIA